SRGRGKPCVAVAPARRPTGPWVDRGFVVCQTVGSIDPAAVRDAAGRRYLVWKRMGAGSGIYGARLSPSGRRLISRPVRLVVPNAEWEEGVTEGPDIVRHGDRYVLVYSGGHCCRPPCTYAGPPSVRLRRGVLRIARGAVSRAWTPRDFTVQVGVAGAGRLAVLLTGGRSIAVRCCAAGMAVLVADGRVVARQPLPAVGGLRLNVRAGGAVAAYASRPRGRWRRVGVPVLA